MSRVEEFGGGHLKAREQHVQMHRALHRMSFGFRNVWVNQHGQMQGAFRGARGVMREEIGGTGRKQSRKSLRGQFKVCGLFPEDSRELLKDSKQGNVTNKFIFQKGQIGNSVEDRKQCWNQKVNQDEVREDREGGTDFRNI